MSGNGQEIPLWIDILMHSWKSILMFFLVLLAIRTMGKRTVANMSPFDVAVVVLMGNIAAIPIEEHNIRIIHGIIPIALLTVMHRLISWTAIKWPAFERIVQGEPTQLIRNGEILHENLRSQRVSIADLWLCLRQANVEQIQDVELCLLEPSGRVSVVLTEDARPIPPRDVSGLTLGRYGDLVSHGHLAATSQLDWLMKKE